MTTTKLSSKGQVVLPRKIRESRRWKAGMEFEVRETDDGIFLAPVKSNQRTGSIRELVGCLDYHGKKISLDEMEEAIRSEARGRR